MAASWKWPEWCNVVKNLLFGCVCDQKLRISSYWAMKPCPVGKRINSLTQFCCCCCCWQSTSSSSEINIPNANPNPNHMFIHFTHHWPTGDQWKNFVTISHTIILQDHPTFLASLRSRNPESSSIKTIWDLRSPISIYLHYLHIGYWIHARYATTISSILSYYIHMDLDFKTFCQGSPSRVRCHLQGSSWRVWLRLQGSPSRVTF